MELTFVQSSQIIGREHAWECEFEAASDFNLHVERSSGGLFLVYQKSVASGGYDIVDGVGDISHKGVVDIDFTALVYPKYIKVVSESKPDLGVVTFNA